MNRFGEWLHENEKTHKDVARKFGMSGSTFHYIVREGVVPKLENLYMIEVYTDGDIKVLDWLDPKFKEDVTKRLKKIKKEIS